MLKNLIFIVCTLLFFFFYSLKSTLVGNVMKFNFSHLLLLAVVIHTSGMIGEKSHGRLFCIVRNLSALRIFFSSFQIEIDMQRVNFLIFIFFRTLLNSKWISLFCCHDKLPQKKNPCFAIPPLLFECLFHPLFGFNSSKSKNEWELICVSGSKWIDE